MMSKRYLIDEDTLRELLYSIHSANAVGIANMRAIIERNGWKEIR